MRRHAVEFLMQVSQELHSAALANAASTVTANPFGKVIKLIQDLLERLLKEAENEVTRESFCDEAIAKANKSLHYRMEEAHRINTELQRLENKRDYLSENTA